MKRPPVLMHVKIRGERRGFGLWLPVFLLLPLALALFAIVSPLILMAILVFWPRGWRKRALHIFRAAFEVFNSMRGLKVDVQSGQQQICITAV